MHSRYSVYVRICVVCTRVRTFVLTQWFAIRPNDYNVLSCRKVVFYRPVHVCLSTQLYVLHHVHVVSTVVDP